MALACFAGPLAASSSSDAFCGFYVSGGDAALFNDATQVVMMRDGTRTVLAMQNTYKGPPENFAMVVPVPIVLHKENVKTLPKDIFDRVDKLTAPRLVEYWEQDPCMPQYKEDGMRYAVPMGAAANKAPAAESHVRIEAKFEVGEYEVVVLSADDSTGLDRWLHANKYKIPDGAAPYLQPYVQKGMKFFVAKVDVSKVKFENGQAVLSPLRFHYDDDGFSLPVRLGMLNSAGTQDLIVEIIARSQRYETSNYPNAFIPTNLEVSSETRAKFGAFYVSLFDATLEKNKGAVVTEYAWSASSCDPCPTPSLSPQDLTMLGADVIPSTGPHAAAPDGGAADDKASVVVPPNMPYDFVITRLHARYAKGALGDDLIFKKASAIEGGGGVEQNGKQTATILPSGGQSRFQGRYIMRHLWEGKIACESPQRGIWGGPPGGMGDNTPIPAQKLAAAPRGDVQLASYVVGSVKDLGVQGSAKALEIPPSAPPKPDARKPPKPGEPPRPATPAPRAASNGDDDALAWLAVVPTFLVLAYMWLKTRQEHAKRK